MHPLWIFCLLVRSGLVALVWMLPRNSVWLRRCLVLALSIMGTGFIFKGVFGSNNETQVAKVFWHETRFLHGTLYLLAAAYLWHKKAAMAGRILVLDVVFSLLYRIPHR